MEINLLRRTLLLISLYNLVKTSEDYDFFTQPHFEEYFDSTSSDGKVTPKNDRTQKPLSTYEVTENVIDVPNNGTVVGDIVTNFTIGRPLNNATAVTNKVDEKNDVKEDTNKSKRKYVSNLHLITDFDGYNANSAQNIHTHTHPLIGDYLNGVKKGFFLGISSVINEEIHSDANIGVYVPNKVANPILLLHGLQRKSHDVATRVRDVATRVHKTVFGHSSEHHFRF